MIKLAVRLADGKRYKGHIEDENIVIEKSYVLKFAITYPLSVEASFELKHDDGRPWTAQQFVDAIIDSYKSIYDQEEREVGNPGHIPGTYNRATSNGCYGIWGHDIGDLVLEGAYKENDVWHLEVGS